MFVNRYRLSEISFVLKAVATLVISMKKAPPAKGMFSMDIEYIYSEDIPG